MNPGQAELLVVQADVTGNAGVVGETKYYQVN